MTDAPSSSTPKKKTSVAKEEPVAVEPTESSSQDSSSLEAGKARPLSPTNRSTSLVRAAFGVARNLQIPKLLVQANLVQERQRIERYRESESILWVCTPDDNPELLRPDKDDIIRVPPNRLSRISQVKLGLLTAILSRKVDFDENVVCLSGISGSKRLDTLVIMSPAQDFKWLEGNLEDFPSSVINKEFFQALLRIILQFSAEGREGHAIGTCFVVGEEEELEPYTEQLILNPLVGHPKRKRSIFNPDVFETLRELAALDGAFVVDPKGTVVSAGTFLKSPPGTRIRLGHGLGARHNSAAGITKISPKFFAVVLSESSGTVTLFYGGKDILRLEKPSV